MSNFVPTGIYRGRAISAEYKVSANKKTEFLEIRCEITDGPFKGRMLMNEQWFGKQESGERALKTLLACGWDGEDPLDPKGIGSTEVDLEIDIEEEQVKEDGSGVYPARNRIKWINEPGATALGRLMTEEEKGGFANKLLALKAYMRIEKRVPGQAPGAAVPAAAAPTTAVNGAPPQGYYPPAAAAAPGAAVAKPTF